jgi:hypothetical protein
VILERICFFIAGNGWCFAKVADFGAPTDQVAEPFINRYIGQIKHFPPA